MATTATTFSFLTANMSMPGWMIYAMGGVALFSTMFLISLLLGLRSNQMYKAINDARRGDKRLCFMHFASGQGKFVIPKLIEPKEDGETSPYWLIDNTYRFKDITGEKWESVGDLKVLNYTARTTSAISVDQAVAMDQFNDILATHGYSTKGFLKEVFFMLSESAKGKEAEIQAWKKLQTSANVHTLNKIKEILDFVKSNPELKYVMLKSGAFTYRTSVSVIDQLISNGVTYLSHTISFVEDRTRRKLQDRFDNIWKYAMIAVAVMIPAAIAGVIFLIGTGMVKM
jgi:3-dehydroquinate dehydratase